MRIKTRMLSILLSAMMVTSMAPAAVFADETPDDSTVVVEEQVSTEAEENTAEEQTVSDTQDQKEEVTTEEEVATTEEVTADTEEAATEDEAATEEKLETESVAISASFDATSAVYTKELSYTGVEVTPAVYVKDQNGNPLAAGTYTVAYESTNNAAVGTHYLVVTGLGDYTGTVKLAVVVKAAPITECTATLDQYSYYYTGSALTPAVKVVNTAGAALVLNQDYTVAYANNVNEGTATVTVNGNGNYTGSKVLNFTIVKNPITACNVTLDQYSYYYTGSAITPVVKVTNAAGAALVLNQDYVVAYSNNVNAGTATITVTGVNAYANTGYKVLNFSIVKTPISSFKVATAKTSYAYNGKYQKPAVTVSYGNTKIASSNYSVSYKNNKYMGTATITVTAKGNNISGTKKITFKITPAVPKLNTAKNVSKGIYLSWSKASYATGYNIYRSADSGKTFKKIASTKSRNYTDKKASTGKKYVYKIASYKKSYVSAASNTKTITKTITKPVISSIKTSGSDLKVTWGTVTGATYELYRKEAGLDWELVYEGTKTYFYDTDTDLNTTYSYKVKAIASNVSATSSTKTGKRTSSSSSGSTYLSLKASKASGADSFYASWNKYKNAVKYQVFWCKYSSFPASYVHSGYTSNLHYQPQEVYVGTGTWYVKVRAITTSGNKTYYSSWSNVRAVTIK